MGHLAHFIVLILGETLHPLDRLPNFGPIFGETLHPMYGLPNSWRYAVGKSRLSGLGLNLTGIFGAVKCQDCGGVGSVPAGGDDFGDIRTVAVAACLDHFEVFQVRRTLEIVPGTDDFRAALVTEGAEAFAEVRAGLEFKVGEACPRLNGNGEAPLGLAFRLSGQAFACVIRGRTPNIPRPPACRWRSENRAGKFRNAAGGDEGRVGFAEKLLYLLVFQIAAVQPDLGEFHMRILQNVQDFLV